MLYTLLMHDSTYRLGPSRWPETYKKPRSETYNAHIRVLTFRFGIALREMLDMIGQLCFTKLKFFKRRIFIF